MTELAPAGIASGETGVNTPSAEVVLGSTAQALDALTGLPNVSSKATVIVSEVTPAVKVCGEVVMPDCVAAASVLI